jgi:hypothetical protein
MASLVEALSTQLDVSTIGSLAQQIGADPAKTQAAVQAALPMLVGALAKNSAHDAGASALRQALGAHDGVIFDDLAGALARPTHAPMGDAILEHVLGSRRPVIEEGLSNVSGLDRAAASRLLATLAPIVMGYLGRTAKRNGFDAARLAGALAHASGQAHSSATEAQATLMTLLDRDGHGSIADDHGGGLPSVARG